MRYLFEVKKDDAAGKRMFASWVKPSPKNRRVPEGWILGRPSTTQLLFSDELEAMRLMAYYKLRQPDRFKIYEIREVLLTEMAERITALQE
jgi:predicted DNA-binding protein (UPF0251 family)